MDFYDVLDESLKRCDIEGDLGRTNLTFVSQYSEDERPTVHHFDYKQRELAPLNALNLRNLCNGCLIIDTQSLTREQCKQIIMKVSHISSGLASLISWQLHLKTDGDRWQIFKENNREIWLYDFMRLGSLVHNEWLSMRMV